jgi:type IV fimbrial biogenesis protein FimT
MHAGISGVETQGYRAVRRAVRQIGKTRLRGVTLTELLIAMAILAILLAAGVPAFRGMIMDNRISAQTSELLADLALARMEAVKRHVRVVMCKRNTAGTTCDTSTAWKDGRLIFIDANANGAFDNGVDTVIKVVDPLSGNNTLADSTSADAMTFLPSGAALTLPAPTFKLCDSRTGANLGRSITIEPSGRVGAVKTACP